MKIHFNNFNNSLITRFFGNEFSEGAFFIQTIRVLHYFVTQALM